MNNSNWLLQTPQERLKELERLRAEHFGYDLNNPPKMVRRITRILRKEDGRFVVIDFDKNGKQKKKFITEEKWRGLW